ALGQNLSALVRQAPARRRAAVEYGDAHQLAHRGKAEYAQFAGLAAAAEHVVLVEFARLDRGLETAVGTGRLGEALAPRADGRAAGDAGNARQGGRAGRTGQHGAARELWAFILFVRHLVSPSSHP